MDNVIKTEGGYVNKDFKENSKYIYSLEILPRDPKCYPTADQIHFNSKAKAIKWARQFDQNGFAWVIWDNWSDLPHSTPVIAQSSDYHY